MPMRPRAVQRSGAKRASVLDRPGRPQRRFVDVLDGPGLRRRLAEHEHDAHVHQQRHDDAGRPEDPLGEHRGERGLRGLEQQDGEQQRVEEVLGVLHQPEEAVGCPGRPASCRATARERFMRVSAVSRQREPGDEHEQHDDAGDHEQVEGDRGDGEHHGWGGAGGSPSAPGSGSDRGYRSARHLGRDLGAHGHHAVEAGEQLGLAGPHGLGLGGLGVVHAQHVQHAVDHQQRHLVVVAARVLGGVAGGHGGADHHVAEQHGGVVVVARRPGRAGGRRVGPAHRLEGVVVDGERQHVGGAVGAHELLVQVGDDLLGDEEDRQLGVALDALGRQHLGGQRAPAGQLDRLGRLLVGDEHLDLTLASTAPPAPSRRRTHHAGASLGGWGSGVAATPGAAPARS